MTINVTRVLAGRYDAHKSVGVRIEHVELPLKHEALLERISIDANICFGKPCNRGHRIWVSLVLDMLADGTSIADILADYPQLVDDDIRACIAYAAEMTGERIVDPKRRGAAF